MRKQMVKCTGDDSDKQHQFSVRENNYLFILISVIISTFTHVLYYISEQLGMAISCLALRVPGGRKEENN